jgi:nucleotide-binding universal stress UspA family protein
MSPSNERGDGDESDPEEAKDMRVLIALDATPQCAEIVREAASRPWPAGSRFFLLHVLDPFAFAKAPISLERAKDAAQVQLKTAAQILVEAGWKTEMDVVLGRPRRTISQSAASWKADFVLVGSNEAGGLMRLLLGSTAQSVLRQASCSVEIVRPLPREEKAGKPHGMKILIATDGSEYSTAALRSMACRPWPKGSKAKVLSIPEPFMPLGEFPYFDSKEIESLNTSALKAAKKYAMAGAEILSEAGLETTTETPFPKDSLAREIVKEAERWHARMVVVGSHGRRGFDRITMGSVSEHVAFHAHCSVEVIRGPLAPKKRSTNVSKKGVQR